MGPISWIWRHRWLRVTMAAYAVLAWFVLGYALAANWGPDESTAVLAGLFTAPLALGLVWSRLAGFKALGFEVSLAQLTVEIDAKLQTAATAPDLGEEGPSLVAQMAEIVRSRVELVEVNLRDGDYWLRRRLFLLASLADELSEVRSVVFVSGGEERKFIGLATPRTLRRALDHQTTADLQDQTKVRLEALWTEAIGTPIVHETKLDDRVTRAVSIIYNWTNLEAGHPDSAPRVSWSSLNTAMSGIDRGLETVSVQWSGYETPEVIRGLVSSSDTEYVALVRSSGSLDRVINRCALATELASRSAGR